MHQRILSCLLATILTAAPVVARPQAHQAGKSAATASQTVLLNKLPVSLRSRGEALLKQTDERERARLADDFAKAEMIPAREFLLALLEQESSARVRTVIIERIGWNPL